MLALSCSLSPHAGSGRVVSCFQLFWARHYDVIVPSAYVQQLASPYHSSISRHSVTDNENQNKFEPAAPTPKSQNLAAHTAAAKNFFTM